MRSKADRPYGRFPGADAAEPVESAPPRPRRWYHPAPGKRAAGIRRRAFAVSVVMLLLAFVAAGREVPRAPRVLPSPTPKPPIAAIYERVGGAVVEVRAQGSSESDRRLGAGVVVDETGSILTSLHVVRDAAITVRFADGTVSPAMVAGELPERDIALLRTQLLPFGLIPAVLGDASRLRVGDEALVIGSPFGLTLSLSSGVISGTGRTADVPGVGRAVSGLLQFDAAVNPGNSGGPLLDRDGEVVGIVVGVLSPTDGTLAQGVGFAVTIDVAGGALGLPPD